MVDSPSPYSHVAPRIFGFEGVPAMIGWRPNFPAVALLFIFTVSTAHAQTQPPPFSESTFAMPLQAPPGWDPAMYRAFRERCMQISQGVIDWQNKTAEQRKHSTPATIDPDLREQCLRDSFGPSRIEGVAGSGPAASQSTPRILPTPDHSLWDPLHRS